MPYWAGLAFNGSKTAGFAQGNRKWTLVLSHSIKHYRELGRLVASHGLNRKNRLYKEYLKLLMEVLQLPATVNKNTNVLHHIMGYFK